MDSPHDVFVSYALEDRATAKAIADGLAQAGIRVWTDSEIQGGELWLPRLEEMLRSSDQYLVLMSPELMTARSWGMYELGFMMSEQRDHGKPVIPVVIRDFGDNDIPRLHSAMQAIDGRGKPVPELTALIAEAIERSGKVMDAQQV